MNLKIKIFLILTAGLTVFIIAGNVLSHKISNPNFFHDMVCKPQNVLYGLITIPIGISPDWTFVCYVDFAIEFSNPTFCLKTNKESCYSTLAVRKLDPYICKNIIDTTQYNSCVFDIIMYTKKPEYCTLIRDFPPKEGFSREIFINNCLENYSRSN